MDAVVAFALKHRVLMVVLFVMMLAGGIMAFRALNIEPDGRTPAETAAFIKDEVQRWGRVIRENKIVVE